MTNIVVSAGRNIGTVPMATEDWEAFTTAILHGVRTATSDVFFVGTGTGIYEGMEEESFTVIASAPSESLEGWLEAFLSRTATLYSQEAIAYTQGTTHFVYAET